MRRSNIGFLGAGPIVLSGRRPFMGARRRLGQNNFGAQDLMGRLRQEGPLIPIQIGIPTAMAEQMRAAGETPPVPEEIIGLIDTGASITAINVGTAQRLGLVPTGSIQIAGATGVSQMPVYAAMIQFSDPAITYGAVRVGGANLSHPTFEILIGRDILCHMHFSYKGPKGQFSLVV